MRVLCGAIEVVVGPLQRRELKRFFVKTRELVEWRYVPLLVSHCCDISDSKDMTAVRHDVALRRPSVSSAVVVESIIGC